MVSHIYIASMYWHLITVKWDTQKKGWMKRKRGMGGGGRCFQSIINKVSEGCYYWTCSIYYLVVLLEWRCWQRFVILCWLVKLRQMTVFVQQKNCLIINFFLFYAIVWCQLSTVFRWILNTVAYIREFGSKSMRCTVNTFNKSKQPHDSFFTIFNYYATIEFANKNKPRYFRRSGLMWSTNNNYQ